jgi:NAD-dependent deacetylase sirtuin 5
MLMVRPSGRQESCGRYANIVLGLLEQTEHPESRLLGIHGTLRTVRCTACDYNIVINNLHDIPLLLLLSNTKSQSRSVTLSDLPYCPRCTKVLRPGVVWFGERLAAGAPYSIDDWISEECVDLVIAIGTSLEVFPAAEWVETVQASGAALAIIDIEEKHRLMEGVDWFFEGNVTAILPGILDHFTRQPDIL